VLVKHYTLRLRFCFKARLFIDLTGLAVAMQY